MRARGIFDDLSLYLGVEPSFEAAISKTYFLMSSLPLDAFPEASELCWEVE